MQNSTEMEISMKIEFSIIIACYNSEKTIVSCLDSIEDQGVEIIIINDCSSDNTDIVLKEYMLKYPKKNIFLHNNKCNIGAGLSRNIGIELATKEYILFLDSDDQLNTKCISSLRKILKQFKSDCVIYDALYLNKDQKNKVSMLFSKKIKEGKISTKEALVYTKGCTWGKVYKRSLITENKVKFAELTRNEDLVFSKLALSFMKTIQYIKKPLYIYKNNECSLMNNKKLLDINNAYRAFDLIAKGLKGRNYDAELNSIYFMEIVYATTMTTIKKGNSIKECYLHYISKCQKYQLPDKYYQKYILKYKILNLMFQYKMYHILQFIVNGRG